MCLILFALNAHPHYKLVLAANRDEFYARPTARAGFWADAPQILAGRDLAAGGTWLGITKTGRFAAVTNYRDPNAPTGIKSRGDLAKDFLNGNSAPNDFLREVEKAKIDYSGFNFLAGNFGTNDAEIFYYSNRGAPPAKLKNGIYGLSNALLDTEWYKVVAGKQRLTKILQSSDKICPAVLFEILADREFAPDDTLPETGVGVERERVLSPAFIETENYGTRISTALLADETGAVSFTEKTFVGPVLGEIDCQFSIAR